MDSKKGQKAKLRERYFIETGIYPLDNLNRYNHWLEDEIVNNINYTPCCKSDSELLSCEHEWVKPIINAENRRCLKCGVWEEKET